MGYDYKLWGSHAYLCDTCIGILPHYDMYGCVQYSILFITLCLLWCIDDPFYMCYSVKSLLASIGLTSQT